MPHPQPDEALAPGIEGLLNRMSALLEPLVVKGDPRRYFLATYQRTTRAVGKAIADGLFDDGAWVEAWDVAFADLYLDALEADVPPGPWRQSFSADPDLPPLRHVLLGINAHINYDLPQALLAVITDAELDDHVLMASRRADHERIDEVLAARVSAEDDALAQAGPRSFTDRVLTPLNRVATKRLLQEARQKVWDNTVTLSCARRTSPEAYAVRLADLERISTDRVADLMAPGQVLLRLAIRGFGVRLDPPDPMRRFDPSVLGTAERDAWACYYRHEWRRFLAASLTMVREGFGMGRLSTLRGAWLVLRANQQWAPYPDNDPDGARATMARFYTLVARVHGLDIDPVETARLEVDWWRAHRESQHDPSVGAEDLVRALSTLYAAVYGVPEPMVREAAALRADAMRVSDAWVADGCDPDADALESIGDLLVRSYASLLVAVRCR